MKPAVFSSAANEIESEADNKLSMKLKITIYNRKKVSEKIVESDDILRTIEDTISEIGGKRSRFEVFCEMCRNADEDYLIFRNYRKVASLRVI